MPTGRYGLAIIGFACTHETKDDMLQYDGKRDEVYFTTETRRVSGIDGRQLQTPMQKTSNVMGDTNGFPLRAKVGTADGINGLGGIRSGDRFPIPLPVDFSDGSFQNDRYPPYKIWEGELSEGTGETAFVTVTLWEWDTGKSIVNDWISWLSQIDSKYGEKAKDLFTKVYPPNELIFSAVSLAIQTLNTTADLLGTSQSRPIGLRPSNPGASATWGDDVPIIIALSYESAEYLSRQNDSGLGQGVISKTMIDAPQLEGNYDVYLKCYKISGSNDDDAQELLAKSTTFAIDAANPAFVADGGATISGFIPTQSDNEDILATITGWRPNGGSHPTVILVKRASQGGKIGVWFRINFANDIANGVVWWTLYQGGNPVYTAGPEATRITFDGQPWH